MLTGNQITIAEDRRINPELRSIFVEAHETIRPFFDETNNWGGLSLEHMAFRALHERFPTLSGEQVFVIVNASKRILRGGGIPAP